MSNLTNSDKALIRIMQNYPDGFRLPSVVINKILKRLESMMVVYSLPDTQGQSLWYLQDDFIDTKTKHLAHKWQDLKNH